MRLRRRDIQCATGSPEEMLSAVNNRIDELEGGVTSATKIDDANVSAACAASKKRKEVESACSGKKKVEGANSSIYNENISTLRDAVKGMFAAIKDPGARNAWSDALYVALGDGSYMLISEDDDGLLVLEEGASQAYDATIEEILNKISTSWSDNGETVEEEVVEEDEPYVDEDMVTL